MKRTIILNPTLDEMESLIRKRFTPNSTLTIDDLGVQFDNPRTPGNRFRSLARRKVLADTHRTKVSSNPKSRKSTVKIWRVRPVGAKR